MLNRPLPLLIMACSLPLSACATTAETLGAYPSTLPGLQRHVIELPAKDPESDYQVELIAGKTLQVDCNQQRLSGQWQQQTVQGWGYDYYVLQNVGPGISTLMACPEQEPREAFVQVAGEPLMLRYNSKLPLVIFAPQDVEIRYRLWSAGPTWPAASQ